MFKVWGLGFRCHTLSGRKCCAPATKPCFPASSFTARLAYALLASFCHAGFSGEWGITTTNDRGFWLRDSKTSPEGREMYAAFAQGLELRAWRFKV